MLDDLCSDLVREPRVLATKISDINLASEDRLHRLLTLFNRQRFSPGLPSESWRDDLDYHGHMLKIEGEFLEQSRARVAYAAAKAPRSPDAFVSWFEMLKEIGPGQSDPLFPWLAKEASLAQMRWFLVQEVAGEAGFDDLLALTQVKMPHQPKLELARNYWDEMGRGNPKGVHGDMLAGLSEALNLAPQLETTIWQALALANTMAGLAANRRYAYHAIGALGVIELTAPGRSAFVAQGLKRLGVRPDDRHYFDLHAVLDVKHSAAWNQEVIYPLVAADPSVAAAIAEGALMRLQCGAECFERYRDEFQVPAAASTRRIAS